MQIVGEAHERLGNSVSEVPIRVKVEGADTVDLGLVDLPGFRAYAKDAAMQDLAHKIDKLVHKFMEDENNVMLCVEEAGDAAGLSRLESVCRFECAWGSYGLLAAVGSLRPPSKLCVCVCGCICI